MQLAVSKSITQELSNGQYRNQVDYILCSLKMEKLHPVSKNKTWKQKQDCGSDHQPLTAKFKLKLKKVGEITVETVTNLFSWAPKSLQMVTAAMKLKDTCSLEEKL